MGEDPKIKLYDHNPKKGKKNQGKGIDVQSSSKSSSSFPKSSAISSYYSTGSSANGSVAGDDVSKPPEVPKESFARRFKYMWPLLLTVNFAVFLAAYLFMRTKKKDGPIEEEISNATHTPTPSTSIAPPTATAITENHPPVQPIRVLEPIPEMRQRELYKWMLEEKRKIKTNDPSEKKRIDEEKAILKYFIQAKSIPSI